MTGLFLFALLFILFSFRQAIGLYVDWLWFQEVGYSQIFTTGLFYKFILGALGGGIFALVIYCNLKIADVAPSGFRFSAAANIIELPPPDLIDPLLKRLLLPGALLLCLMAAPNATSQWERLPLFFNPIPFNPPDPQFGLDIGFYIFRLPMYEATYHWLMFALALTLAPPRRSIFFTVASSTVRAGYFFPSSPGPIFWCSWVCFWR